MQVATRDQRDTYGPNLTREEHVGNSTLRADKQVTCLDKLNYTSQSQTIESLLPDEDDLFSGVPDILGCIATAKGDDEDFDLFSSSGGMELEGNLKRDFHQRNSVTSEGRNNDQNGSGFLISCEHPSRTLLVKNVDNRVTDSDLRLLFEQHGDIETFNTTSRCQGFVILSYYDIRAATSAFTTLQNKPVEYGQLQIHFLNPKDDTSGHHIDQASFGVYNRDSCTPNEKLHQTYGNLSPQVVNSCVNEEYIYGVHSLSKLTINAIPRQAPLQANCCFTNSFPSPVGITSAYNQFAYGPHYSTDQAKLHNQCLSFHPQSLPINCKGFVDNGFVTYGSLNLASVGFTTEPNNKHLHMVGSYGSPVANMFKGSPRIGRSGFGGLHQTLNCSSSFQDHHLNRVTWSQSPPVDNSVCAHNTSTTVSHKSSERDPGTASHHSLGKPRNRARRNNHGRHENNSCLADEKKYELDIERVLRGEDCRTTLMIKNIPNKYSSAMLLAAINEHNQGTYDFIYLPLDFKNKCNMGYAFINMTDPQQIVQFHKSFHGKKWEKYHSGKVACLAYARIQGKSALIAHFQESSLMNEDKCCHPILFTTDGPNAGSQEPFPLGPNIHSRRQKNRCNAYEVNENQDFLSASLEE